MVGEYVLRTDGDVRRLIINYKGSPFGADVAQYAEAMKDVIDKLKIVDADEIVLSEYYERIYNAEQTTMLRELANLINRLETDSVWSPSHLGNTRDSKKLASRHDAVLSILNNLYADPFKAYLSVIQEAKTVKARAESYQGEDKADFEKYLETLEFIHAQMEKLSIVKKMKVYVSQLGEIPTDRGIYHSLFEVSIKPSFIGSRIFFSGIESLELVDQYEVLGSTVYIYKHPDSVEYRYYINPPEYTLAPDKYFLLEKTKEVVAGHRPGDVGFMDAGAARQYFHKVYVGTISDLAKQNNIDLSVEEKEDLATIVSRYTIGYGILELLLSDRQLTDVYLDSPLGTKPIYLVHSKYGQCQTNIIFSQEEALSIVSRFRAMSGRPFDEAHPILDFDLADLQTRIAVIGKPLAVDGTAFAFRLHKDTPWTLAQFLDGKMFNKTAAGLFSFFVDAQASMLIVGSRGSGKTSFLQAMMQEIPQNLRIIVQEDSVTGDSEIVAERNGVLQQTTVGELVDGELAASGVGFEEYSSIMPVSLKVFSVSNGRVKLSPVSKLIRHRVTKPLYKLTTVSGKSVTVTGDHSLFRIVDDVLIPVKTALLQPGDRIAGANVGLASDGALQQLLADYVEELVAFVEPVGTRESFVYDLSVPESENFVCNGIVAHNTQELPVPALKRFGFNIQRMKTRPPLGKQSEAEVSAEDALRTALRLGDSVLIVGEVRSGEARALYEAMRVGAVGNVVMGTIHGESAYSIWDRVVNDLGVPTTSFKATDFAIVAAPIRFKGSLKRNRRLVEVTEVLKHWNRDPGEEGGFLEWMRFDANKDEVDFFTDKLKDSEWVKRVGRNRGLSLDDIMDEANARGDSKQALVDLSKEFNVPRLLEAEYTVRAHNKYLLMGEKQREEFGSVDHQKLLEDWNAWARDILTKEAVAEANAAKVS